MEQILEDLRQRVSERLPRILQDTELALAQVPHDKDPRIEAQRQSSLRSIGGGVQAFTRIFLAQLEDNGGAGTWPIGVSASITIFIAYLAYDYLAAYAGLDLRSLFAAIGPLTCCNFSAKCRHASRSRCTDSDSASQRQARRHEAGRRKLQQKLSNRP